MSAQTVREITVAQAKALIAGGKPVAEGVYAVPARGITVALKPLGGGKVRAIITKGCAC